MLICNPCGNLATITFPQKSGLQTKLQESPLNKREDGAVVSARYPSERVTYTKHGVVNKFQMKK